MKKYVHVYREVVNIADHALKIVTYEQYGCIENHQTVMMMEIM